MFALCASVGWVGAPLNAEAPTLASLMPMRLYYVKSISFTLVKTSESAPNQIMARTVA